MIFSNAYYSLRRWIYQVEYDPEETIQFIRARTSFLLIMIIISLIFSLLIFMK